MAAIQEDLSSSFIVSKDEANLRLDKLLSSHFPEHSRTYFQFLLNQGGVLVNGLPLKKKEKINEGSLVEVYFILTPEMTLEPQEISLEILYEDEHLIAINKPAGMVVHPAPGHPKDTFANALLFHCRMLPGKEPLRPGIVHRLDKDTSGGLLAAKTLQCHGKLIELFSQRKIEKHYLAICVGTPTEGLIDAPIRRHPIERKKMCIGSERGKEAKTLCRVLKKNAQLSYVEAQILTGRTHQIRVHLKSLGTPVLGDTIYGSSSANLRFKTRRQLLHAHRTSFIHPITGAPILIEAPIPEDLNRFILQLEEL